MDSRFGFARRFHLVFLCLALAAHCPSTADCQRCQGSGGWVEDAPFCCGQQHAAPCETAAFVGGETAVGRSSSIEESLLYRRERWWALITHMPSQVAKPLAARSGPLAAGLEQTLRDAINTEQSAGYENMQGRSQRFSEFLVRAAIGLAQPPGRDVPVVCICAADCFPPLGPSRLSHRRMHPCASWEPPVAAARRAGGASSSLSTMAQ